MKTADIKGYRDLSEDDVATMNRIKELEVCVADFWKSLSDMGTNDPRDLALARTHLEDGFIRLVRSVAKPQSPYAK